VQGAADLKASGVDDAAAYLFQILDKELTSMDIDEAVPLTRAFSHYLALTGIAEMHHR
jgi:phosphoenolpyruvate carboxylase